MFIGLCLGRVILETFRPSKSFFVRNRSHARIFHQSSTMAKSKFEYVRLFETEDRCLPNSWIVVRVDGKGFHKFSTEHDYEKPNDMRALSLMNKAATSVMEEFKDICLAYGQSDEYSFVFRKETQVYSRRSAKLSTNVCSLFTSAFVYYWSEHFPSSKPLYPPVFDGRTVLYPSNQNIRDYLSWRQADCHINNLYNTTFWALILKAGLTAVEAEQKLKGTLSGDKNEILFSQFSINYNKEPEMLRKGTILVRRKVPVALPDGSGTREKSQIVQLHTDVIGDEFWNENNHLLTIS
ncbi:probable tRNA(His) guanylyltransferase isoform X2 [Daphnia pulex]|uniref:probable tRNA(His) guanylyltransferase isoform X2 n=1 Tax=Daphnia pulex TaxID=6669 RepID=UPI001EDCD51F|nr:probable tRNA(His) guanylyltransferase isoform X2 [Daphnia pulex]